MPHARTHDCHRVSELGEKGDGTGRAIQGQYSHWLEIPVLIQYFMLLTQGEILDERKFSTSTHAREVNMVNAAARVRAEHRSFWQMLPMCETHQDGRFEYKQRVPRVYWQDS